MSEIQPSRQELEDLWAERLEDAKLQLDVARNDVKKAQREWGSGSIPSADGHFAYRHALQAETLALKHYQHLLTILRALSLTGKIPDEQE